MANVKLSIAQHEGHQAVFEAAGAQLFTPSSQEQITEKNGLLKGAGLSLTYPLGLKFLVKLKVPQSDVEQCAFLTMQYLALHLNVSPV